MVLFHYIVEIRALSDSESCLVDLIVVVDHSSSTTTSIAHYNRTCQTAIVIRYSPYLNNIVEQDHRAVKRIVRPMLDFKSLWAARCTMIAGIEVMHAMREGQLITLGHSFQTPIEEFYALAA